MTPAARIAAAIEILDAVLAGQAAEQQLTSWARRNRFAGSGDRAAIRDHVFGAMRCRRSFATLGGAKTGRGLMLGALRDTGANPSEVFTGEGYAPAKLTPEEAAFQPPDDLPTDLPDWVLPQWNAALGDRADAVAEAMRHRAPVFLRVNLRKASRAQAAAALHEEGIETVTHPLSSTALQVTSNPRRVQNSGPFRDGLVELQDAASQAISDLIPVEQKGRVLDYCAGGGGKSLALAARTDARFYAHDADPRRMKDLPGRAKRAGVRVNILQPDRVAGEGPFDVVLCDVPCSGSGAWRRSPEGKWSLTPQRLAELQAIQFDILQTCAGLVAPGGVLAYATCSVLQAENADQISRFTSANPNWRVSKTRQLTPLDGGDGFFVALLQAD
ncbi:SAM-dependent methlyltransferase [Actibacterium mucosum KCTC 23349]|uniref:SAM-dependent methlyltransferase n=1 Tax=Actibacterium mucosum KCTC 23349 TaxID=1454373 RepID=A0A037ZG43_9RHOB|nr:RsmB/NOP family class I SAM-dependent RNA methyltransferase [Actibacterium mucosum]KAJ55395.1 SAM-dependent methlyltransferase [Actibacterium mucosum KCTC 23349]